MNGTQVNMRLAAQSKAADAFINEELPAHVPAGDPPIPYNIPLRDASVFDLAVLRTPCEFGNWINTFTSTAFKDLQYDPTKYNFWNFCTYSAPFYDTSEGQIPMQKSFEARYLPDIDGKGYSARFRSFVLSKSVPIKSTVWSEWHNKRLVPWKHFVPMNMGMDDIWGIMEHLLGYRPPRQMVPSDQQKAEAPVRLGQQDVGKRIAMDWHDWGQRVLRKGGYDVLYVGGYS